MSKGKDTTPQDVRVRRSAEALRRNLKRRKLQARERAAADSPSREQAPGGPKDTEKQDR